MSKNIVITGGSRGIGAATARLAGARGWSVTFSYQGNEAAAKESVAAVEKAGGKAVAVRAEITSEADVNALFDTAIKSFGPIDGVSNSAGIVLSPPAPLADMTVERIRKMMDVNVVGAMLVAREGVRRMARSRGGHGGSIVNVSSASSRLGSANEYVDYAASKGAIDSLTLGLAREAIGDGVRVNAIRPGVIDTEIHASGGQPGRQHRVGPQTPMGRAGTAEEVAETILWLLSDASSYINAAIIDVTGGR
jgi:NAD(P)-dependent dehydrogenase (short-subunit alcohol dehydrogenase family)